MALMTLEERSESSTSDELTYILETEDVQDIIEEIKRALLRIIDAQRNIENPAIFFELRKVCDSAKFSVCTQNQLERTLELSERSLRLGAFEFLENIRKLKVRKTDEQGFYKHLDDKERNKHILNEISNIRCVTKDILFKIDSTIANFNDLDAQFTKTLRFLNAKYSIKFSHTASVRVPPSKRFNKLNNLRKSINNQIQSLKAKLEWAIKLLNDTTKWIEYSGTTGSGVKSAGVANWIHRNAIGGDDLFSSPARIVKRSEGRKVESLSDVENTEVGGTLWTPENHLRHQISQLREELLRETRKRSTGLATTGDGEQCHRRSESRDNQSNFRAATDAEDNEELEPAVLTAMGALHHWGQGHKDEDDWGEEEGMFEDEEENSEINTSNKGRLGMCQVGKITTKAYKTVMRPESIIKNFRHKDERGIFSRLTLRFPDGNLIKLNVSAATCFREIASMLDNRLQFLDLRDISFYLNGHIIPRMSTVGVKKYKKRDIIDVIYTGPDPNAPDGDNPNNAQTDSGVFRVNKFSKLKCFKEKRTKYSKTSLMTSSFKAGEDMCNKLENFSAITCGRNFNNGMMSLARRVPKVDHPVMRSMGVEKQVEDLLEIKDSVVKYFFGDEPEFLHEDQRNAIESAQEKVRLEEEEILRKVEEAKAEEAAALRPFMALTKAEIKQMNKSEKYKKWKELYKQAELKPQDSQESCKKQDTEIQPEQPENSTGAKPSNRKTLKRLRKRKELDRCYRKPIPATTQSILKSTNLVAKTGRIPVGLSTDSGDGNTKSAMVKAPLIATKTLSTKDTDNRSAKIKKTSETTIGRNNRVHFAPDCRIDGGKEVENNLGLSGLRLRPCDREITDPVALNKFRQNLRQRLLEKQQAPKRLEEIDKIYEHFDMIAGISAKSRGPPKAY